MNPAHEASMPSTIVNVRYIVDDVDAAVAWYTKHLGFSLLSNAAPAFADVTLGSLRLLLSGPRISSSCFSLRAARTRAWTHYAQIGGPLSGGNLDIDLRSSKDRF